MAKAKTTSKTTKDLKSLDATELKAELLIARKELFSLRMKHSLGELKQSHLIRKARQSVAQISTSLHASL